MQVPKINKNYFCAYADTSYALHEKSANSKQVKLVNLVQTYDRLINKNTDQRNICCLFANNKNIFLFCFSFY